MPIRSGATWIMVVLKESVPVKRSCGWRKLFAAAGLVSSLWSTDARGADFPLEWALLEGPARTRLVAALTARGRTNEVALIEALAQGDSVATETALRRLVAASDDRRLGDALVRLLRASGRADEAEEMRRTLGTRRAKPRKLAAATPVAPTFSGKTPVVFLHGYGGDFSTWKDYLSMFLSTDGGYGTGDLLVFHYYDEDSSASVSTLDQGITGFGFDTDKSIAKIADRVLDSTTVWLRRRCGLADGDASHDGELPAVDWVCHSMGGLVFRHLLANRPGLVRRCVTLGSPHFGQSIGGNVLIGQLVGKEAHEMSFGSSTLWDLAATWHYLGKRTDDILFVAGLADRSDGGYWHDGLVPAFSTTMQTADDLRYAANTYFVMRVHTALLDACFDLRALTELSGKGDPLYCLVHGYLNDCEYFAGGHRPTQKRVLEDDGCSDPEALQRGVAARGGLFVQVMQGRTNIVQRTDIPVEFHPGLFAPDNVVEKLTFADGSYDGDDDGLVRGNGYDDEGCEKGLVLLYGDIPTGDCEAVIGRPWHSYEYPEYKERFHLAGGGVTLVRTRIGAARAISATTVADIDGVSRSVAVPNDWLVAKGLARHAEDLDGCVGALSGKGANGWPVAASYLLGLEPTNAVSTLRISSFAVGDGLSFGVSAGGRPLVSGEAPVVLQTKRLLGDAWDDAATPVGSWTLPRSDARFFRAAFKW